MLKKKSGFVFMKGQYESPHMVNNFPQIPAVLNKALCQSRDTFSCIMMPMLREQVPQGTETSMSETRDLLFYLFYWKKWRHHAQGRLMNFFFSWSIINKQHQSFLWHALFLWKQYLKKSLPACLLDSITLSKAYMTIKIYL